MSALRKSALDKASVVTYSDVKGDGAELVGSGCIDLDPLFADGRMDELPPILPVSTPE